MKKNKWFFIFVIGIMALSIFVTANRGTTVDVGVVTLDTNKVEGKLKNWISRNNAEGVYLGRIPQTNKHEDYYIYLNNKKISNFSISDDKHKGLAIAWGVGEKPDNTVKLIKMSTKNKIPEYIILEKKKIVREEISIIE